MRTSSFRKASENIFLYGSIIYIRANSGVQVSLVTWTLFSAPHSDLKSKLRCGLRGLPSMNISGKIYGACDGLGFVLCEQFKCTLAVPLGSLTYGRLDYTHNSVAVHRRYCEEDIAIMRVHFSAEGRPLLTSSFLFTMRDYTSYLLYVRNDVKALLLPSHLFQSLLPARWQPCQHRVSLLSLHFVTFLFL